MSRIDLQKFARLVLFVICLLILAVRLSFLETTEQNQNIALMKFSDISASLTISAILIFMCAATLLFCLTRAGFSYKSTGIGIGLAVFTAAQLIAVFAATDKRAAITTMITLTSPILMAILLVQLLDSPAKIKLTLIVITALAVVNASQCFDQAFFSKQVMIEQYEQNPTEQLDKLGIVRDSFNHFLYEHRLYSKGTPAFFKTSNSTCSYFILAVFAGLSLFIAGLKRKNPKASLLTGLVIAAVIFGIVLTRSKGGIASCLLAGLMFGTFVIGRKYLTRYKKTVLFVVLILLVLVGVAAVGYGIRNDRLPGGKSMLVRWQYWTASAKMLQDNPLGVGGGNFTNHYPIYKDPAALETVSDPHNFLLSFACQFGIAGLVGLLAMIFVPLIKIPFSKTKCDTVLSGLKLNAGSILMFITAAMLIVRPILIRANLTSLPDVMLYLALFYYIVPAAIFFIAAIMLNFKSDGNVSFGNIELACLFCGLAGFLAHNVIDFAIFEPAIWTAFWAVMACAIAMSKNNTGIAPVNFTLKKPLKFTTASIVCIGVGAFLFYGYIPVVRSNMLIDKAVDKFHALTMPAILSMPDRQDYYKRAELVRIQNLLDRAYKIDPLNSAAVSLKGSIMKYAFDMELSDKQALFVAESSFLKAAETSPVSFKHYEKLADVYISLGDADKQNKQQWLNRAMEAVQKAVKLYPAGARLHYKYAQIAEQLGQSEIADIEYAEAKHIKNALKAQFRIMYPALKDKAETYFP